MEAYGMPMLSVRVRVSQTFEQVDRFLQKLA